MRTLTILAGAALAFAFARPASAVGMGGVAWTPVAEERRLRIGGALGVAAISAFAKGSELEAIVFGFSGAAQVAYEFVDGFEGGAGLHGWFSREGGRTLQILVPSVLARGHIALSRERTSELGVTVEGGPRFFHSSLAGERRGVTLIISPDVTLWKAATWGLRVGVSWAYGAGDDAITLAFGPWLEVRTRF